MNTSHQGRHLRSLGIISAAALFTVSAAGQVFVPTPVTWDTTSEKQNWVSFSGGWVDLKSDSNAASYQRQRQHEDAGFGGIDALRVKNDLGEDRSLLIEGKGLVGDGEYLLKLRYADEGSGLYLEGGFKESRVFYNGAGGYFPPNQLRFKLFDEQIYVDRGIYWLEGGYSKNQWSFRLRYSHDYREGRKDSTMWGDTNLTGISGRAVNITPAFYDIDETRDTIMLELDYDGEQTDFGAGVRWESYEQEDSRYLRRLPYEASATPGNQDRTVTTTEGSKTDLFASHVYVESRANDKLMLTGAASMTKLDANLSGDRIFGPSYGAPYNPAFPRRTTDHGYIDLEGDSNWKQYVLTGSALYTPAKAWSITGGVRYENQSQDLVSDFIETAGGNPPLEEEFEGISDRDFDEFFESLEVNFTGVSNWVFTAYAEAAQGTGDMFEEGGTNEVERETEFDRDLMEYGLNFRWYPSKQFNLGGGVFERDRENSYHNVEGTIPGGDVSPTNYPAFITEQDLKATDYYLRATVRPVDGLSLVVRYDDVSTEIDSQQYNLPLVVSGEQNQKVFSGTLSWTPVQQLLVQVGMSSVDDELLTGLVGSTVPVAGAVATFNSDYNTYNALVMVLLDDRTDLQFDYYKFDADNYEPIAALTLPYGLSATDETFGVTITRRFSDDLLGSIRYAYGEYEDLTSGGYNDFKSQLLYGRIQVRF